MQSSSSGVHDSFRHLNCSMSNSSKHGEDDDEDELNRRRSEEYSCMNLLKRSAVEAALDHHHLHHHHNDDAMTATDVGMSSDEDSSDNKPPSSSDNSPTKKTPPPNGKKTKGRVKIKMEFIDNKLRRYTTFSKRKTGIMKKAYELSTLTGTQVMLLVASETGHVYTFATRKLQPMITSEAGKALIQTCLNSPDPLLNCGSSDQRMSATGFEETEFTYSIADDDPKMEMLKSQGLYTGGSQHGETDHNQSPSFVDMSSAAFLSAAAAAANSVATSKGGNISMQLPTATGFNTILASSLTNSNHHSSNTDTSTRNTVTVVPTSQQGLSMVSGNMVNLTPVSTTSASAVPGTVMYQTPQGVVYATPTSGTLPEGVIFNFGQLSQDSGSGPSSQQYITIPVSLTSSNQIVHGIGSNPSLANLDGGGRSSNSVTDLSKSGVKCSQVVIPACVPLRSIDAENAAKKLLAQSEVSKIR